MAEPASGKLEKKKTPNRLKDCLGLVKDAIVSLHSRHGSSVQAILNQIGQGDQHRKQVQACINRATKRGILLSAPRHARSYIVAAPVTKRAAIVAVVTKKSKRTAPSRARAQTASTQKASTQKALTQNTANKKAPSSAPPSLNAPAPVSLSNSATATSWNPPVVSAVED